MTPFYKVVHKYDELPELSLGTIQNYFLTRRQFRYLGFICFFTFIFRFAGDSNQDFLQCAEVRYPEPKLNFPSGLSNTFIPLVLRKIVQMD